MNRISLVLAALLTCVLAGCAPPPAEKKSEPTPAPADPSVVDKVRNDFMAAFNAGDSAKVMALYAVDAVMMPPHQPTMTGRAAIEDYNKKFFEVYSAKINITPVETKVFGDRGLDRGTYTLELTPKAGGASIKDDGKYLVLVQRQADGTWKVTHDIDNTSMPAPPPEPAPAKKK